MAERRWRVRLGAAVELDFANIVKWTTENFGTRQSRPWRAVVGKNVNTYVIEVAM